MEKQSVSTTQGLTLRANAEFGMEIISVLSGPINKPKGVFSSFKEMPPTVTQVTGGYRFKVLGEERDCYRVEIFSGKVGYVLKEYLVAENNYIHLDSHPVGKQVIRSKLDTSYNMFAIDSVHANGIHIYEKPDSNSKPIFILGLSEAVQIVETLDWYYRVVVPGPTEGFVYRNHGVRREWAPKTEAHFGFCGVRKGEADRVSIRYAPDYLSESIADLDQSFRLPVVEEWDNWFRIQLQDGSLGFVPEQLTMRALRAETLVSKAEGSGNVVGSLLAVAGLLVAGTVGAALKDS